MPKNASFWHVFFLNFASGAKILTETSSFWCFERARKINLDDLKKIGKQSFQKFSESPPPLEKILDQPTRKIKRVSET